MLFSMSNFDEDPHVEGAAAGHEPTERPPLTAFAQRHRFILGLGLGAVMLAVLAWSLIALPEAGVPGFYGLVQRFAFPLMYLFIAAIGFTWALGVKRVWTTLAAYGAIVTYALYYLVGWIYEAFIA